MIPASIPYAILNSEGRCINRTLWDGISPWRPPAGYTAVPDPDNEYSIWQEPQPPPDPVDLTATAHGILAAASSGDAPSLAALLGELLQAARP